MHPFFSIQVPLDEVLCLLTKRVPEEDHFWPVLAEVEVVVLDARFEKAE